MFSITVENKLTAESNYLFMRYIFSVCSVHRHNFVQHVHDELLLGFEVPVILPIIYGKLHNVILLNYQ